MKLLQNVNLEQPNSPDGVPMTGRVECSGRRNKEPATCLVEYNV